MNCSLPGSSVHRHYQTRILEWVAMPSSRGSSWPRNQTGVSSIAGGFFTSWAAREAHKMARDPLISWTQAVEKQRHPTPVLLPGKSHGQRSLVGCSPWGHWELDTIERLHFHFYLRALEREMATHSSVLAWRIPGMKEPGGLLSMGSHRVRHDWSDSAAAAGSGNFNGSVSQNVIPEVLRAVPFSLPAVLWMCAHSMLWTRAVQSGRTRHKQLLNTCTWLIQIEICCQKHTQHWKYSGKK